MSQGLTYDKAHYKHASPAEYHCRHLPRNLKKSIAKALALNNL